MLDPVPLFTCTDSVIEMILLGLGEADLLALCALQVDHELLDWVILSHHFDGALEGLTLVLKLVSAYGLLDQRNVRCEIAV